MERYEAYKDSGVEWIGELPIGWEVMKLKYIASLKTGYTPSKEKKENYSDNGITWVKPNDLEGFSPVVGSKEKVSKLGLKVQHIVPKGSLLVCCIGSIGKFGIAGSLLITNQQINALVFNNFVTDAFSKYLIAASISEHQRHANGNVVKILNTETQGSIFFPIPPKPKQTAIANFLDRKTAEIDALIAQKERLLGLYEEEKTAIINHAVTKGIDPNAELKDSGVAWLGEIPVGWKIKRIKYLATDKSSLFIDGDWIESKDIVFDESQIRYITTGNIGEGQYKEQGLTYITHEKFIALNCTEIFPGDLIISRLNPPIGRSCIVPNLGVRIVTSVDNVVLRPDRKYRKKYLMYSMCSNNYFEYTSLIARGATMQRISRSLLGDVALPIPSSVEEQTAIVTLLDRKMTEINAKIAKTQHIIELQKEYRTALISEAVTGKIKVPELPTQEASA